MAIRICRINEDTKREIDSFKKQLENQLGRFVSDAEAIEKYLKKWQP